MIPKNSSGFALVVNLPSDGGFECLLISWLPTRENLFKKMKRIRPRVRPVFDVHLFDCNLFSKPDTTDLGSISGLCCCKRAIRKKTSQVIFEINRDGFAIPGQ